MRIRLAILIPVSVATTALADAVDDPWALLPALPTACYTQEDDFDDQVNAVSAALQEDRARQKEINETIAQQYREIDPMVMQQKMIEFMMANPAEAERVMVAMQQTGMTAQEEIPAMANRRTELDAELKDLTARYQQTLQETRAPIEARRLRLPSETGECTQATFAGLAALNREENQAYRKFCVDWWKDGGAFHLWLAKWKQFHIEWAAQETELASGAKLNYEMMGISTDQYRDTDQLDAASEYLNTASRVFSGREYTPISEEPMTSCHDHG